jgi:hypothetical protein
MRVAGIAVVSWLAAMFVITFTASLYHGEVPSAADAAGLAGSSFVGCALLLVACYLPGLRLLGRSRFGASPMGSALAVALVFNIPAFLALAVTARQADAFAAGEVWWLAGLVGLFGAVFGFGHARLKPRGLTRA